MITKESDRERELSRQIDEQGAQLEQWRDRAIAAEAELARLRAQESFGWFYDITNGDQKQGPIWQGGEDRKITEIVAEDIGAKVFPLYRAAPPAQPAEPVQRLSDERAAFEAWHNEYRTQELVRRDDTYYNTHVRCRWEGWQARAIESALQPGWRDIETPPGWKLVPICLTPEMREVLLMADRFTVGEVYIMLLAAAPKATK